ncbi:hypothetical protein BC835DRAFT_1359660 [Cytidiella melzeri]|nr:hypothetical protein BC835DRAFT_1359660 [Cytidiella melzeri]
MRHDASTSALIESFKRPVPSHPSKRNVYHTIHACRQCRKRKLKCDGRRPCSTCLRSHAYLVDHPLPGVPPPPEYPECIYDRAADEVRDEADDKAEGYQKLKNRISELEGRLRDMTLELQKSGVASVDATRTPSLVSSNGTQRNSQRSSPDTASDHALAAQSNVSLDGASQRTDAPREFSFNSLQEDLLWLSENQSPAMFTTPLDVATSQILGGGAEHDDTAFINFDDNITSNVSIAADGVFESINPATIFDSTFRHPSFGVSSMGSQLIGSNSVVHPTHGLLDAYDFEEATVIRTGWSPHLPDPATTRRLAEAFFAFHIHAGRLFHGPSFLASLDLHPLDARFPSVAALHALCAVGSTFVAEIQPTPIHTHSSFPYVIFHGRWRRVAKRPDSFAEHHAKLALHAVYQLLESGEHIISILQAQVLLSWFFRDQSRWSESFMNSGAALRNCIPLGLNICSPFKIPDRGLNPGPILQDPHVLLDSDNVIEQETRRNVFWLCYAMERQIAITSTFAMELDDQDINQLLPVRGDQFDLGVKVPMENRQFSNDSNVLSHHPPQQTDSFIMFIKASMLISRVKAFITRYKGRYHAGDATMYSLSNIVPASIDDYDPRDTPAFQEVDQLLRLWRDSFPHHMRVIQDETVDPHLYTAMITGHVATALLHDPWANMDNPMCPSAGKTLKAARAILDLMYLMSSTSYDVSLLDQMCISGWYIAGRVLIRFLHAAIRHNYLEHIVVLHTEVSYVHDMLSKAGERVPAACNKRILFDILVQSCGEQFADPPTAGRRSAYIDPAETPLVDRGLSKTLFGNLAIALPGSLSAAQY